MHAPAGFDFDRRQAAEYLGLEPKTLAEWAASAKKKIPYAKIGSKTWYRRSDCDALIRRSTVKAA